MKRMDVINRVAKWGLILGLLMSISKIIETNMLLSGSIENVFLLAFEIIVAIVIYLFVCYLANIENWKCSDNQDVYSLRSLINHSIAVSLFAGVIVGLAVHIYVNLSLGGYLEYMQKLSESMIALMDQAQLTGDVRSEYMSAVESLTSPEGVEAVGEISIFESVISTVMNYVIGGFISGLAVAHFVNRYGRVDKRDKMEDISNE